MDYRSKTALIYDNGLFVEWARLLAKDFGTVYYAVPWEAGYPRSNTLLIGHGLEGVKVVDSIWPLLDTVDLWIFPDVNSGPLQSFLNSLGKRVWGPRYGEELELFRADSKWHAQSLGIDIGPWKLIKGIDALRAHLKKNDDQWVKISRTRGDFETWHSESYELSEPKLNELEHQLGVKAKIMEFIVEAGIPAIAEIGYDGYCIDGQFPKRAMTGVEVKDRGLVMRTLPYDRLPEEVRGVNEKLAPTFKKYGYRGFWSSEIRIGKTDRKPYLIDPCCRAGAPPNELMQIMVKNWPDIFWGGAEGEVVEPEFTAKWGAELLLISDWGDSNFLPLTFPEGIRENVKLRYACKIDGQLFTIPQASHHPEVGAVVATGQTMQDAIKNVRGLADQVKGFYLDVHPESLDDAEEQFRKMNEAGIKI